MKKILTVSLVAIMAVGAAHAQIASTDWTMEQLGATETTLQGKIDEKVATSTYEQDKTALQGAIDAKVAQSDYDTKMTQVALDIASKVAQTDYDTKIGEIETTLQDIATNTEFSGLTDKVTALEESLADDGATGSRIVALEGADATMSGQITALQTADTTMAAKIGTVEEGKNLATMLSEETTARENADTQLQTNIDAKFAKTSTVKGAVVTTTADGDVAPVVPTESEDGVYVLTATKNGDSVTYYWENIARKTPASEPETPNGEES